MLDKKTTRNGNIEQAKNNLKIFEKIIDDFTQNEDYISVKNLLDYLENISEDIAFTIIYQVR